MSSIHFVSNKIYKKRIVQMGENPNSVVCCGSPSIDLIKKINFCNKNTLKNLLKIDLLDKIFVVTYNPITTSKFITLKEISNLLKALGNFKNCSIIFTLPNYDYNSDIISKKIKLFCKRKKNFNFFKSLGHTKYLSLIKMADLVIGNSSSGIIEAPYLKTPTINIGKRQSGREMSKSVFCCDANYIKINKKINYVLKLNKNYLLFKKKIYGNGNATEKITKFIKNIDLNKFKSGKKFKDIKFKI